MRLEACRHASMRPPQVLILPSMTCPTAMPRSPVNGGEEHQRACDSHPQVVRVVGREDDAQGPHLSGQDGHREARAVLWGRKAA